MYCKDGGAFNTRPHALLDPRPSPQTARHLHARPASASPDPQRITCALNTPLMTAKLDALREVHEGLLARRHRALLFLT